MLLLGWMVLGGLSCSQGETGEVPEETPPDASVPDPSDASVPDTSVPPVVDQNPPLRTLFVSTSGDDERGDGSEANPWRTLAFAATQLVAGDELRVQAGTYQGGVWLDIPGTQTDPIRIKGVGGPTLIVGDEASAIIGFGISASHIIVTGFNIEGEGVGYELGDRRPIRNPICADLEGFLSTFDSDEARAEFAGLVEICARNDDIDRPVDDHLVENVLIDGQLDSGNRARIAVRGESAIGVFLADELRNIRIRNYHFAEGRHAVLADGVDSYSSISGLEIENIRVGGTLNYGLRIIARQAFNFRETPADEAQVVRFVEDGPAVMGTLSAVPIRTQSIQNFALRSSEFIHTGFTSEVTGEGYGAVLIQGIDGGVVENSRFIDGAYWGLDALICNNILYRNNVFVMQDITVEGIDRSRLPRFRGFPFVNLEVNGGVGNVVVHNLFVGGEAGVFESLFPEDFFVPSVDITVQNNLFVKGVASISRFPLTTPIREGATLSGVHQFVPVAGTMVTRVESDNLMDKGANIEPDGGRILGDDPEFFGPRNQVVPNLDLQFQNEGELDFRMRASSPAVDSGLDLLSIVAVDALGVERPQGSAVDIGPYER